VVEAGGEGPGPRCAAHRPEPAPRRIRGLHSDSANREQEGPGGGRGFRVRADEHHRRGRTPGDDRRARLPLAATSIRRHLQPFFFTVADLSLATKLASGGAVHIDPRLDLTAAAALLVGVKIGSALTGCVDPAHARTLAIALAYAGAAATVLRAIISL
jgi:hypothetical protein